MARLDAIGQLIGDTPLLAIALEFDGLPSTVYAKLEAMNMTGSVKDRIALHMLRRAWQSGTLVPGAQIIEATSGNTGISLAAIGGALGHPVTIFMPASMSVERINLMRSLGADIRLVSEEQGGFLGAIEMAEDLAARTPDALLTRQFSNPDNTEAHALGTGPELWKQLLANGTPPDAFVAGVGTGGTVMGVGQFLRSCRHETRVFPLEPASSPTLSTGNKVGRHRIQGISDDFVPPIVDLEFLDEVLAVDDGDAIRMAQALSTELGLAVGISSGANLLGALLAQQRLGADAVVATVFADSNKKYLTTDLMREEPARPDHLTPRVLLRGFDVLRRASDIRT